MVVKPMIRNNICMNAHPVGSRVEVDRQISYVQSRNRFAGPRNVLVIGGSGGYGLASRIAAAFGAVAGSLNVAFERAPSGKRTGTVGYYMSRHLDRRIQEAGLPTETLYGDAFSYEMKDQAVERIRRLFGTVDLVVYSLASGVRTDPDSGVQYRSTLKTIGAPFTERTLDPMEGALSEVTVEPATEEEIEATVKVMGGEDWLLWMRHLKEAGVLAEGVRTVAYSYIGPELTNPIYRHGTIGRAKDHLEGTVPQLNELMGGLGGRAWVSVNKAVVTRASAVIPVVPLYLAILFRIMKAKGIHEGCIEQMDRLLRDNLYWGEEPPVDSEGRLRVDDLELRDDVQNEVMDSWKRITQENLDQYADLSAYRHEFLALHGFDVEGVDYEADVDIS